MDEIRNAVVQKLGSMEADAPDPCDFWLQHQYLLSTNDPHILLDFLGVTYAPLEASLYTSECEVCDAFVDVVFDSRLDEWICESCGSVQTQTRTPYKRFIPESSKYKHDTHLHQILYELQCFRHKLPPKIVEDVHFYLELEDLPATYATIQKALRPLGYKQHYSMIPTLLSFLSSSYVPLRLSKEEEIQLHGKFHEYIALGKMEGMEKNRLSYHYVLYQISGMIGLDKVRPYLKLPRGDKSRKRHDTVWRSVCQHLKWSTHNCDFLF